MGEQLTDRGSTIHNCEQLPASLDAPEGLRSAVLQRDVGSDDQASVGE
jgi:hypothetical protein